MMDEQMTDGAHAQAGDEGRDWRDLRPGGRDATEGDARPDEPTTEGAEDEGDAGGEEPASDELDLQGLVGLRLRALRESEGVARSRLACAADASDSHLAHVEAGVSDVTVGMLSRFTDCLGVTLADFFADPGFSTVPIEREHPEVSPAASVAAYLDMPPRERCVLEAVASDPDATILELSARTGVAPATVQRLLARMAERGLVRRVGSRRSGHWEVLAEATDDLPESGDDEGFREG